MYLIGSPRIDICLLYLFLPTLPTASNSKWVLKVLHSAELHKRENPIVFIELRRNIDKSITFDGTKGGIRALKFQ